MAGQHALLMEFDSAHGHWRTPAGIADGALVLDRRTIPLTHETNIKALPLSELGINVVIDCTGVFKSARRVAPC